MQNDELLCKVLADDLRKASYLGGFFGVMRHTGLFEVLDEQPCLVFRNLRRSAIPPEDAQLLGRCGVEDPDAEITILIAYCRSAMDENRCRLSQLEGDATEALTQAAEKLERFASETSASNPSTARTRPTKKLFTGIGRILAGAVTGAGEAET